MLFKLLGKRRFKGAMPSLAGEGESLVRRLVEVTVSDEVKELGAFVAFINVVNVKVEKGRVDLAEKARETASKITASYTLERLKEHPIVRAYRDFMWRLGIDPTKVRPSSEALVRRVLRYGKLPQINNVVDAGNIASVETLIPIGIYDVDRVDGDVVVLRKAEKGELFIPIGGSEEELKGIEIVLADSKKVLHVFPHRDSRETMVRDTTRNVLVVGCGVPGVPRVAVKEAVARTARYLELYAGGRIEGEVRVVP